MATQPGTPPTDFPDGLAAPALRALSATGYTRLSDLADVPASELGQLHGMGRKALTRLQDALEQRGLTLG